MKIRVLIADDHQVTRHGLASLLRQEPDLEVVGEAADGRDAIASARKIRPQVVIMDVNMPETDGIHATRIIRAALPATQVIGLSMFEDAETVAAMRAAGASDYLPKSGPPEALLAAVRSCVRAAQDPGSTGTARRPGRPPAAKPGQGKARPRSLQRPSR